MGTEKKIDPSTNGGKMRAARKAAKKSLADIGGYNVGYLSRVERNFLPVSTGVLASYEEAVGHPIDVTPEATVAPKPARRRGKQTDRAAFIVLVTQWIREQPWKDTTHDQAGEGIAYLLGFIDGAAAFRGPGLSQAERDTLEGTAAALSRMGGRSWQGETAEGVGVLAFQEHLVVQTARVLIGGAIADLDEALAQLRQCYSANEVIQMARGPRYAIFSFDTTATQAVIFRAMHDREQLWRNEARPETIPYTSRHADLVRSWLRLAAAFLWPPALTEQEALAQAPPAGPYQTFRGPVVVRWNNACCHERCAFCGNDFKPAIGLWAFLHGLGRPVLCLDCWRKGPQVNGLDAGATTIPAEAGHLHVLAPADVLEYAGYCSLCGAHWTAAEGWWRKDAAERWCREVPTEVAE